MRAVIIANGDPPTASDIQTWLRPGDTLICADGGGRAALALNLSPQHVIGDFDSLTEAELRALAKRGATLHRYPTHKDETDLELALLHAAQKHREIVILGACGGRLDQTLANVMLLAMPQLAKVRALIAHGRERTFLIPPGARFELIGDAGDRISLLPMGGDAHGVTTEELEYPLTDETLRFGPARGVSNIMASGRAFVRLRQGHLLCVQSSGRA